MTSNGSLDPLANAYGHTTLLFRSGHFFIRSLGVCAPRSVGGFQPCASVPRVCSPLWTLATATVTMFVKRCGYNGVLVSNLLVGSVSSHRDWFVPLFLVQHLQVLRHANLPVISVCDFV